MASCKNSIDYKINTKIEINIFFNNCVVHSNDISFIIVYSLVMF
jgi:hypothetical protein